jgi:hypothetical protein
MPKVKRNICVVLTDHGAGELGGVLKLWLKQSELFGAYVYCKSVDPNGPYFHMLIEEPNPPTEPIGFEVQVPHGYIKAILCASDLKKLGFV